MTEVCMIRSSRVARPSNMKTFGQASIHGVIASPFAGGAIGRVVCNQE
jgi:hypothetical protein